MFIKFNDTIIAKASILKIKPCVRSIGDHRLVDEREWRLDVYTTHGVCRFWYPDRADMEKAFAEAWDNLSK